MVSRHDLQMNQITFFLDGQVMVIDTTALL